MSRRHPIADGTVVTSGFRTLRRPTHNGTDFHAPTGTPLYASQSGTVKTGTGHPRAGTWIEIHSPNGDLAGYSHLTRRNVVPGQHVVAGELIGYSGATGNVAGPHLHFYTKRGGKFINPVKWLAESVSTPTPSTPSSGGDPKVRAYQERQNRYGNAGLKEDGVDGPKTKAWRAWVKTAQHALNLWKSDHPDIAEDGDYGNGTHARVAEMQRRNGRKVTGVLSDADAKFMRSKGTNIPNRPKVG